MGESGMNQGLGRYRFPVRPGGVFLRDRADKNKVWLIKATAERVFLTDAVPPFSSILSEYNIQGWQLFVRNGVLGMETGVPPGRNNAPLYTYGVPYRDVYEVFVYNDERLAHREPMIDVEVSTAVFMRDRTDGRVYLLSVKGGFFAIISGVQPTSTVYDGYVIGDWNVFIKDSTLGFEEAATSAPGAHLYAVSTAGKYEVTVYNSETLAYELVP